MSREQVSPISCVAAPASVNKMAGREACWVTREGMMPQLVDGLKRFGDLGRIGG